MDIEIANRRTERSKTYAVGGGKRKLIAHCKPIHYHNGGSWKDIVIDFQTDGGDYVNQRNRVQTRVGRGIRNRFLTLTLPTGESIGQAVDGVQLDGVNQTVRPNGVLVKESNRGIRVVVNDDLNLLVDINEFSASIWTQIKSYVTDFRIRKRLMLTGITCSNDVAGDYYVPDEFGRFNFVDANGGLAFWIPRPRMIDANGVSYGNIEHSLATDLTYIKTPGANAVDDLILAKYPIRIDADTVYSSTSDGYCYVSGAGSWSFAHDATSSGGYNSAGTTVVCGIAYSSGKNPLYAINRAFYYFDTSSIGAGNTVTACDLKQYVASGTIGTMSAQEGTQAATISGADYDAFTGTTYGTVTPSGTSSYCTISFNSTGLANVNIEGETKVCVREYTHDYLNSAPGSDINNSMQIRSADYSGTTYDPYLEVTYIPDTPGGTEGLLYWEGTEWLRGTLKYYDGADWVNASLKWYDGADWLTI